MARLDQASVVTTHHDGGIVRVAAANRRAAGRCSVAIIGNGIAMDRPLRVQRHVGHAYRQ
ncbi:hypothetical protein D3C73_847670 [compost metagenome]